MSKPDDCNQAARGRGWSAGSRNECRQRLMDLVVLAADLSGYPRTKSVQATDLKGKRLYEMRDERDANGKPIKDKSGSVKRVRCRDENGRPIPVMKETLVYDGDGGAVGYLRYFGQTQPRLYFSLLKRCKSWTLPIDTAAEQKGPPTAREGLRAELERRGIQVDDLLAAIESEQPTTHEGRVDGEGDDDRSNTDRRRHR